LVNDQTFIRPQHNLWSAVLVEAVLRALALAEVASEVRRARARRNAGGERLGGSWREKAAPVREKLRLPRVLTQSPRWALVIGPGLMIISRKFPVPRPNDCAPKAHGRL
jgi:hypothetical protein